ncbi:MAG: hypothetical protein JJU16_01115 [Alkalibacterium sp.]|nr:hypothetical protein [Alkalibacterium sp.]
MEKMKKRLISLLVIGSFLGMTVVSGQFNNVSAEEMQEESVEKEWEEHFEAMQGHMNRMHGRTNRFRGTEDERSDNEENDQGVTDEERDLFEDRHNRMWEFENGDVGESDNEQSANSNPFFGNMRNHMRGFRNVSFDDMFEWMQDMHGSFEGRRGMMNWNQDEQTDDSTPDGFMNRFDFFNSNE